MAKDPTIYFMSCVQVLRRFLKVTFETEVSNTSILIIWPQITFFRRVLTEVEHSHTYNTDYFLFWLNYYFYGLFVERLKLKTASEYTYLSQSDCLTIAGVDDAQKFHKLLVIVLSISSAGLCFFTLPDFWYFFFPHNHICRKLLTLFKSLKSIKSGHLHCLRQCCG